MNRVELTLSTWTELVDVSDEALGEVSPDVMNDVARRMAAEIERRLSTAIMAGRPDAAPVEETCQVLRTINGVMFSYPLPRWCIDEPIRGLRTRGIS